jgi:hypothetical protein
MKINLANLAKESDSAYRDVKCSFGVIRVYHVPDALLLSAGSLDRPDPELPVVRMKTATGYQNRQAKEGDDAYTQWLADRKSYEDELFALRNAAGYVYSLKDLDWSEYDLTQPPPSKRAQEIYNGNWPKNELLRKKAWLDWTVLFRRSDQNAILEAMAEMRGENEPTEEGVEEVKKNSASSSGQNQKA